MQPQSSPRLQLALGTGAFAFRFAVFGSLSAMMPILSRQMHLSPVQKSVAVALPVLLGSLGRIPLGMLTDRFGGRLVFSAVMLLSIIPAFLMGTVREAAGCATSILLWSRMRVPAFSPPLDWDIDIPCGCEGHPRGCTGIGDGSCFCNPDDYRRE